MLILAALAALAAGRPASPRTLLFIRDGDIYVAAADGSDQQRMAEGHAVLGMTPGYIRALWSPDAAHILAVRDRDRDRDPGVGHFDRNTLSITPVALTLLVGQRRSGPLSFPTTRGDTPALEEHCSNANQCAVRLVHENGCSIAANRQAVERPVDRTIISYSSAVLRP